MSKKKILIVIDMQHDFVDGSLGSEAAQAIVPKVQALCESHDFTENYYTFDTHYSNYSYTLEGQKLPIPHCIKGTQGWTSVINPPDSYKKGFQMWNTPWKDTFGYLGWLDATEVAMDDPDEEIESITIVGLCTDICVISNALILRAMYPNTKIVCDASCCAGTTPEAHKAALAVMKSCQIDVINE